MVYEKYSDRENDIVEWELSSASRAADLARSGTAEGTLLPNEQIPGKPMNTISGSNVMWSKSKRRTGVAIDPVTTHPGLFETSF